MTTVAYRDGIMAADSLIWMDDTATHSGRKLRRLRDGSLVGFAGSVAESVLVMDWLDGGGDQQAAPRIRDAEFLLVKPSGAVFKIERELVLLRAEGRYHAIGAGQRFALGAMFAGADAATAVRAAIKHGSGNGGRVRKLRLHP